MISCHQQAGVRAQNRPTGAVTAVFMNVVALALPMQVLTMRVLTLTLGLALTLTLGLALIEWGTISTPLGSNYTISTPLGSNYVPALVSQHSGTALPLPHLDQLADGDGVDYLTTLDIGYIPWHALLWIT